MKYILTEQQFINLEQFTTGSPQINRPVPDDYLKYTGRVLKKTVVVPISDECKNKWTPLLKNAKDYWIKWLSHPTTKQKFKINYKVGADNKVNGHNVDEIFKSYIDALNKTNEIIFYNDSMKTADGVDLKNLRDSFAFWARLRPFNIFVNCSLNSKDPLGTLIHELQHLLYDIFPLNPEKQIGDVFVKQQTKLNTPSDFFKTNKNNPMENINFDFISNKVGGKSSILKNYYIKAINYDKKDPGYICNQSEKMSNISSVRRLFNIKPGDNITIKMLKPYLEGSKQNTDVGWIIGCWALNKFPDLQTMLNKLNRLALDTETNSPIPSMTQPNSSQRNA